MANNLSNYLVDITAPSLTSSNYAHDLQVMAQNIDNNFKKIISAPFMQGDPGENVEIVDMGLYENYTSTFTEFGKKVIKLIYGEVYNNDSYANLDLSAITTYGELYDQLSAAGGPEEGFGTLSCEYLRPNGGNDVIKCNRVDGRVVFNAPYFFIDARTQDGWNFIYNTDLRERFVDMSCALFGQGLYINDEYIWADTSIQRYFIMPRLYWNSDLGMFCWKVNDEYTRVTAQGMKGDAGDAGHIYITSGVLIDEQDNQDDTVPFRIQLTHIWEYDEDNQTWEWKSIASHTNVEHLFDNSIVGVWFGHDDGLGDIDISDLSFTFATVRYEAQQWIAYYGSVGDQGGANCDMRSIFNSLNLHSMLDEVGVKTGGNATNVPARTRGLFVRDRIDSLVDHAQDDEYTHIFGMEENLIANPGSNIPRALDRDKKIVALAPVQHQYTDCQQISPDNFPKQQINTIDRLLRIYYNTEITGDTTLLGTVNIGGSSVSNSLVINEGNVEVNAPLTITNNVTIGGRLINKINIPSDHTLSPCLLVRPRVTYDLSTCIPDSNGIASVKVKIYTDVFTCLKYSTTEDHYGYKDSRYYFIKRYETLDTNAEIDAVFYQELANNQLSTSSDFPWYYFHTLQYIENPWKISNENTYIFLSLNGYLTGENVPRLNVKEFRLAPECFITSKDSITTGDPLYFTRQQLYSCSINYINPPLPPIIGKSDTYIDAFHEDPYNYGLYEFVFPIDSNNTWKPNARTTVEYVYSYNNYRTGNILSETNQEFKFDISKNLDIPVIQKDGNDTYINLYSYTTYDYNNYSDFETIYPNLMLGTSPIEDADVQSYISIITDATKNFTSESTFAKVLASDNAILPLSETNMHFFFDAPATLDLTSFHYVGSNNVNDYLYPYLFGGVLNRRNALPANIDRNGKNTTQAILDELHQDDKYTITTARSGQYSNNCIVRQNGSPMSSVQYNYGTQVSLEAIPGTSYYFSRWSDNDVTNPRTVTVTSDQTYTAVFAQLGVVIPGNDVQFDSTRGNVGFKSGGQAIDPSVPVQEGTSITIEATPETGYGFAYTNITKGANTQQITENPYTLEIYNNMSINVVFTNMCTVTVVSADPSKGTVTGSGDYPAGTYAHITATPASGYVFTSWSDGNTEADRTVFVNNTITYTANFVQACEITVTSQAPTEGIATGSGTYAYGTTTVIHAYPAIGYKFQKWVEDNDTNATRTIAITGDATYTAKFEPMQSYTVTVSTSDPTQGVVSGGGTYIEGTEVMVTAAPLPGYSFSHFTVCDDMVCSVIPNNPYSFIITSDVTCEAVFDATYTVRVEVSSGQEDRGTVTGTGTYPNGSSVTISAIPAEGYAFSTWDDSNKTNPRQLTVSGDATYIASFGTGYTINATPNYPERGTVTGGGVYVIGAEVTLEATSNAGYSFSKWSDNDVTNPRTVTVVGDESYEAIFA